MTSPRGKIYSENNRDPKTAPWGTPKLTNDSSEAKRSTEINWYLSDRYDLNEARTCPCRPIRVSYLNKQLWWSVVSKSAQRSGSTRTDAEPWSDAIKRDAGQYYCYYFFRGIVYSISAGSMFCFSKRGLITATFREFGIYREPSIMLNIGGASTGSSSLNYWVGIGASTQLEG